MDPKENQMKSSAQTPKVSIFLVWRHANGTKEIQPTLAPTKRNAKHISSTFADLSQFIIHFSVWFLWMNKNNRHTKLFRITFYKRGAVFSNLFYYANVVSLPCAIDCKHSCNIWNSCILFLINISDNNWPCFTYQPTN